MLSLLFLVMHYRLACSFKLRYNKVLQKIQLFSTKQTDCVLFYVLDFMHSGSCIKGPYDNDDGKAIQRGFILDNQLQEISFFVIFIKIVVIEAFELYFY